MKAKCDCGKDAVYLLMSASKDCMNPYYCDDCVSRGCSCNNYFIKDDYPEDHTSGGYKMEGDILIPIDEQGREYPCVEYDYSKDGYEI